MNQTLYPFKLNNYMDPSLQTTDQINSQVGFTFCPTFSTIPFILNSHNKDPQHNAFTHHNSKIDEQQLRLKLLNIFKKDKKKYQFICDKLVELMGLQKVCQNIKAFSDFINKTILEDSKSSIENNKKSDNSLSSQSNEPNLKRKPLTIFSTQVSFLSTIFSRDKIQVILQVHTAYQKIQNFLNFLFVSLQSFNFTNEKEWILMKDEIERYLLKYEKNVSKLLEVTEEENKTKNKMSSFKQKENLRLNQQEQTQAHPEIYGSSEINTRLEDELNLKQYKRDIVIIRQKVKDLQITMCTAIRNSFMAWYEKFEKILENLKSEMDYICKLLEKAKKFDKSIEKYQIIDFLLITRAKGLEGIIFLQQIYKCILVKLEESRLHLFYSVTYARNSKIMDLKSKERVDFVLKEQGARESADKTFRKLKHLLNIKSQRETIKNYSQMMVDQSESEAFWRHEEREKEALKLNENVQMSKKQSDNEEQTDKQAIQRLQRKQKKIKKDKKDSQKGQKMQLNIILRSPQKKSIYLQMNHKESTQKEQQKQPQLCSQQSQQNMISQCLQQKDSSSLEFLMRQEHNLPGKQQDEISSSQPADNLPFETISRKSLWDLNKNSPKQMQNYEEIESLSIEEEMELDFGEMDNIDSNELIMFEKGFNDEEIRKMERNQLLD